MPKGQPSTSAPPSSSPASLGERLALLPRFYGYKDLLAIVFEDDRDAFIDALCDSTLPLEVQRACEDTMQPRTLEIWLLQRLVRQINTLITEVRK